MTDFYIHEGIELDYYNCDQNVIVQKKHLPFLPGYTGKDELKSSTLCSEHYTACNSYYPHLEDITDALERATNLFPSTESFESLASAYADSRYGTDFYSERGSQLQYLHDRPVSFIILGKPGIGEKDIGKLLAEHWKCVYIHPETLIEEEIASSSRAGECIEFNLRSGRAIGVDIILRLVEKRIKSKSATHRGFVICGFPLVANDLYQEDPVSSESAIFNVQEILDEIMGTTIEIGIPPTVEVKVQVSKTSKFAEEQEEEEEDEKEDAAAEEESPEEKPITEILPPRPPVDVGSATGKICAPPEISLNYEEQINFLFSLMKPPFIIVYVACSNADVMKKRHNYRFNTETKEVINLLNIIESNLLLSVFSEGRGNIDDMPEDFQELIPNSTSVDNMQLQLLTKLPRDFTPCVAAQLQHYRFDALPTMEHHILKHDPQFWVKLDGRLQPQRNINALKMKLRFLPLQPVLIPQRFGLVREVMGGEGGQLEEINVEGMTPEEFFEDFKSKEIVNRQFQYSWSDWGAICPVSMKMGTIQTGDPKFCVHFMNKMFFLSDEEACQKFVRNPRPYLSMPFPCPVCRIAVIGGEYSGKTVLSKCLAYLLNGRVIDPVEHESKYKAAKRASYEERVRSDAITEIMAQIELDRKRKIEQSEYDVAMWLRNLKSLLTNYIDNHQELNNIYESWQRWIGEEEEEENLIEAIERKHHEAINILEESINMADQRLEEMGLGEFKDNLEECQALLKDQQRLEKLIPENLFVSFKPLTVYDKEVQDYAEMMVESIDYKTFDLTFEDRVEVFRKAIEEAEQKSRDEGNYLGGWVIDGFPPDIDLIRELGPLFAKEMFVLLDNSLGYEVLVNRFKTKGQNDFTDFHHLFLDMQEVDAAYRAPITLTPSYLKMTCMEVVKDLVDYVTYRRSKTDLGEFGEENEEYYPWEIEEEEYFSFNPRQGAIAAFKERVAQFQRDWDHLAEFQEELDVRVNIIEIQEKSVVDILQNAIQEVRRRYTQHPTILTSEEKEQEILDFGAPPKELGGEEEEPGEEEQEEGGEDIFFQNRRFGDTSIFCPVTFHENFVLWRGKEEFALKYESKVYLFRDEMTRNMFENAPEKFLLKHKPVPAIPPPRICVVGPSGSGKTILGKALRMNYGLFYVDAIKLLTQHKSILDEFKHKSVTDETDFSTQPLSDPDTDIDENEDESNGYDNDELLSQVIGQYWIKEPQKSVGFVMDGFPKRRVDFEFMVRHVAVPDLVIELMVEPEIARERMINFHLENWRKAKEADNLEREHKHEVVMAEWMAERTEQFDTMMEVRRQERFALMTAENEMNENAEFEEGERKENEEEMSPRPQISFDSVADALDAQEVNAYLDEILPMPILELNMETAEEAVIKIDSQIAEEYSNDLSSLNEMRDMSGAELISWEQVNANMPMEKVLAYILRKCDPINSRNNSFLERVYDIEPQVAEDLLNSGYHFLSKFGRFCPVQHYDNYNPVQTFLANEEKSELFPVIHRQYIYFCAGKKNRDRFKEDPLKYIKMTSPIVWIPMKVAIIGPPKSGKSTLAERFHRDLGLKHISIGSAVRYVLKYMPTCTLAEHIEPVLARGWELTPEMEMRCVAAMALDGRANTQGVVLDGFPNTRQEVLFLAEEGLIPHLVIDLQATKDGVKKLHAEGEGKHNLPNFPFGLINHRYNEWLITQQEFRSWFDHEYQILGKVPVVNCKWGVWNAAFELAAAVFSEIMYYYRNFKNDMVLRLANMQVSPLEFYERMGSYKHFCPACMHYDNTMIHNGDPPDRTNLVQYIHNYYWLCDQHINEFFSWPQKFLPPYNAHPLPRDLPIRISCSTWPEDSYQGGYCVVCYVDYQPDRVLKIGSKDYAVRFNERIYLFDKLKCLEKFLRIPHKYYLRTINYENVPPYPPLAAKELPVLGFLEQYDAQQIIKAVSTTGLLRPLVPGLSVAVSAVINMGLMLKIYNPKTKPDSLILYKRAHDKLLKRHLNLQEHLLQMKDTFNPYLSYDDVADFEDPSWYERCRCTSSTLLPKLKSGIKEERGDPSKQIIEEILNRIDAFPISWEDGYMGEGFNIEYDFEDY